MGRNRHKKEDKSWIWLCSIIAVFFITFSVLLLCASLRSKDSSSYSADKSISLANPEAKYYPPLLRSLIINPESKSNYFDFILDEGKNNFSHQDQLKPIAKRLIQYFFLGLVLPSEDFWVNLNPVQPDKIASPRLTATDMGKVLLETDLKLKKDAARFTDPRTPIGQRYWAKLRQNLEQNGISNLQSLPLSRLWIVPNEAILQERGTDRVNIISASLKVCLEAEYLKQRNPGLLLTSSEDPQEKLLQDSAISAMKEVIVPVIEHDVNYSKRYAPIREIYYSLILAEYYKQKYWGKKSIYDYYINQGQLSGLHSRTPWNKRDFFDSYVKSYKEGEYSFYQQEYDPYQFDMAKKHYFSGGTLLSLGDGFRGEPQILSSPANTAAGFIGGQWLAKVTTDETNLVEVAGVELSLVASPIQVQAPKIDIGNKIINILRDAELWLTQEEISKAIPDIFSEDLKKAIKRLIIQGRIREKTAEQQQEELERLISQIKKAYENLIEAEKKTIDIKMKGWQRDIRKINIAAIIWKQFYKKVFTIREKIIISGSKYALARSSSPVSLEEAEQRITSITKEEDGSIQYEIKIKRFTNDFPWEQMGYISDRQGTEKTIEKIGENFAIRLFEPLGGQEDPEKIFEIYYNKDITAEKLLDYVLISLQLWDYFGEKEKEELVQFKTLIEVEQTLTSIVKKRPDESIQYETEIINIIDDFPWKSPGYIAQSKQGRETPVSYSIESKEIGLAEFRPIGDPKGPEIVFRLYLNRGIVTAEKLLKYLLNSEKSERLWFYFDEKEKEKLVKFKNEISSPVSLEEVEQRMPLNSPAMQQQAREFAGVDLSEITFKVIF